MEDNSINKNPRIITMADDLKRAGSGEFDLMNARFSGAQRVKEKIVSGISETASIPAPKAEGPKIRTMFQPKPITKAVVSQNMDSQPPKPQPQPSKPQMLKPRPPFPSRIMEKKLTALPPSTKSSEKAGKQVEFRRDIAESGILPKEMSPLIFRKKKKLLMIMAIFFIIIAGGTAFYKFGNVFQSQPKEPIVVEEVKPLSILTISGDEIIKTEEGATPQFISGKIKNLLNNKYEDDSFTRILIQDTVFDPVKNIKYLSFNDFKKLTKQDIGINMPARLIDSVDSFDLAIYSKNQINRLVIVAMSDDIYSVSGLFTDWEKTIKTDLSPILSLMNINIDSPDSMSFIDNKYKDIDVRYLNFDGPRNTIDYAIIPAQNIFIITSSRDSMYAVLDDLL
jgi:hypothetical protein